MNLRSSPRDQSALGEPADLVSAWRDRLVTEPFLVRVIWLLFLDLRGRPLGPVMSLDDVPDGPYAYDVEDLAEVCRRVLEGPGIATSVSFVLTRPGPGPWTVSDRAWGRFLTGVGAALGDSTTLGSTTAWPVLLGRPGVLEVFR